MLTEIERLLSIIDEMLERFEDNENYPKVYDLTDNKQKILILKLLHEILTDF